MDIQVQKLREALEVIGPAVPRKSKLEILKNILLKDGAVVGLDLDTAVAVALPEVTEAALLPYRQLVQLLKTVPGSDTLRVELNSGTRLTWSQGSATYPAANVDDYPLMPQTEAPEQKVDGDAFMADLLAVESFCATEESRPVLTGVHLIPGPPMAVAAGDGFRMAYQELRVALDVAEAVIVPRGAVRVLAHCWKKAAASQPQGDSFINLITSKRPLFVAIDKAGLKVKFRFGDVTILCRLIDGMTPGWIDLIPQVQPKRVTVWAQELDRAVKQVAPFLADNSIIRLSWTEDGVMQVTAHNEDVGTGESNVPVTIDAEPGRTALNYRYLAQYLEGKDRQVTIGITNESSPILFRYEHAPVVVIMPMFVQWDNEPTPPAAGHEEKIDQEVDPEE